MEHIGDRTAEVLLGNGLIQTFLNNDRTHSQVQTDVPKPNWGNSSSNRLGYDGSGRAIAKRYLAGGIHLGTGAYNDTTPVVGFTTEYDHAGNKMFERELHAETRSSLYQPFDEKGYAQGGYDSLDRLRKVLRGELSATGGYSATGGGRIAQEITLPNTDEERKYLLDGLGNWEQSDYIPVGGEPTVDLRQHNKLNQITSQKENADPKALFTYDSNGNLKDDGVLLYDYDALNRLTQVRRKSNNQIVGQYSYDAQNRRARKTISNGGLSGNIPSGTIDFIYRDWQVMEERSGSTVNKQYIWGEYIDECIQLRTYVTSGAGSLAVGTYYPLQDLLYRTKALTDTNGDIVEAYDYDPYGNTLIFSAAGAENNWWADDATQANYSACEVLFCGYRYDPESKQYQVRNREYSPALGRWLQRDPIGFDGGDWNLYCYITNNPVNSMDAYGLWKLAEPSTWFDGNGYQGSGLEFNADAWHRGGLGAQAAVDGIVPFWDPFADAGGYNPCDSDMQFSWKAGAFARDVYLGSKIPNLTTWAKNPGLYELGQTTVPYRIFQPLENLSAIERGAHYASHYGGVGTIRLALEAGITDWGATVPTGLTPAGYAALRYVPPVIKDAIFGKDKGCECN